MGFRRNARKEVAIQRCNGDADKVELDKGNLPVVKTLGVLWNAKEDEFRFKTNAPERGEKRSGVS